MLGPLNIALQNFGVSNKHGFLPNELPLKLLPDSYYNAWERIVAQLPYLIKQRTIRTHVGSLEVLSTSKLLSEREWQRAYVVLAFMTHGYIWGGETPSETLPPTISVPFVQVSTYLGLPPVATEAALVLWNYHSDEQDLTNLEALTIQHTLTGTRDEEWFYIISLAIEEEGAKIIPVMLDAMDAVRANNPEIVRQSLVQFAECVQRIGVILKRMHEQCSPDVFYHQIRPMLAGSKNMGGAGLPNGVLYDQGNGKGQWCQYSGGSNAQSSLIQFLDIALGIEHFHTRPGNGPSDIPKVKGGFLHEMRLYMPGCHRRFLERVEDVANIRQYVQTSASGEDMTESYNLAVDSVTALRDIHIQIVARYIIAPSRKPFTASTGGLNLAISSTNRKMAEGLPGTGGTELIPFLKQSRDETKQTELN